MGTKVWLAVVVVLLSVASGNRISEKIYQNLDATYSCFTITNATHEFGCRADFSGNVGLLRVVNTSADLRTLLAAGEQLPYVVVLPRSHFTVPTLRQLESMTADPDRGDVKGVLLALPDGSYDPDSVSFSEDDVCPNHVSSFYWPAENPEHNYCRKNPWNPDGSGMFKQHWSFPIILLRNETQISDVFKCHARFNGAASDGWPRCAAELRTFMAAAGNSEICWRRTQDQYINTKRTSYCSPMGSINVFGTLLPRGGPAPAAANGRTVLLAARADGVTMFDALAPAADSAAVGLVALVSVARALARLPPPAAPRMNAMFMLFSGESFDYIGSDRFVYDMAEDRFPPLAVADEGEKPGEVARPPLLHLSDVQYYLELSQLALGRSLFLHSDPVTRAADSGVDRKVKELIQQVSLYAEQYNLSVAESAADRPLPPASLHRLLKNDNRLPGLVVADHDAAFTNRRYHSVYDVASTVGAQGAATDLVDRLTRLTQVVASAVYGLVSGRELPAKSVQVDPVWLRGLVECYLERSNCSLFRSVMDEQLSDSQLRPHWQMDVPIPTYVSVSSALTRHASLMRLTQNLLARETGTVLTNVTSADQCANDKDKVYVRRWLVRETENGTLEGYCTLSLVSASLASSPAFEIDDYDWSSGAHPSWAESRWTTFSLRLFLKPSLGHDLLHLLLGLAVTALATAAVLVLEKRADLVFASPRSPLRHAGPERRYGTLAEPVAS